MADERREPLLTDDIRELLKLMQASDLAEVLIERGDARVHIKRVLPQPQLVQMVAGQPATQSPVVPVQQLPGSATPALLPTEQPLPLPARETVTAPMVGTFYASPSPKDPPYVRVGDEVRPGDVVGLIEAMKIMNEIECEVNGRIAEVLVTNGQAVEYGQLLLLIEPMD
ncbi:MAG: acetyl-CoA carboxylase biotin carboxyl carrier protein [Herpetosiphon sp.]